MQSMLVSPRAFANLLQKIAETKRVARSDAEARAGIDAGELAHRGREPWRLHARGEFQRRLGGTACETMAFQQAQAFGIQARGQQRIRSRRFPRVQLPLQTPSAYPFVEPIVPTPQQNP